MLNVPAACRIWLSSSRCDMRKGFDGLLAEVWRVCGEDPFAGHLFVFVGRTKNRAPFACRALPPTDGGRACRWSEGGLSLYCKRMEKGQFRVPVVQPGQPSVRMDAADLAMMLGGIDWTRARRQQLYQPPGSLTKIVQQGDRQTTQSAI